MTQTNKVFSFLYHLPGEDPLLVPGRSADLVLDLGLREQSAKHGTKQKRIVVRRNCRLQFAFFCWGVQRPRPRQIFFFVLCNVLTLGAWNDKNIGPAHRFQTRAGNETKVTRRDTRRSRPICLETKIHETRRDARPST